MIKDENTEYLWNEWLSYQDEPLREFAGRFPPWEFYRMEDTGQIVSVVGFYEDGTVRVYVSEQHNDLTDWRTGFEVFGIKTSNLKRWEPPVDPTPIVN